MADISTGQAVITTISAMAVPYTLAGKFVQVKNIGMAVIYIGTKGVTTSTGYPLNPGDAPQPFATNNPIYAVTATGTSTLAFLVCNS